MTDKLKPTKLEGKYQDYLITLANFLSYTHEEKEKLKKKYKKTLKELKNNKN